MKIVKILLGLIAVLVLVYFVGGMFLSDKFEVEVSKEMNVSPTAAYGQVNNLKSYTKWMPWAKMDPDMKVEYSSSNPVGVGQSYSWNSEKKEVGSGTLKIVDAVPNSAIKTEILFGDGQKPSNGSWKFESMDNGNKTNVTWSLLGENSTTAEKWFGLLMHGMMVDAFNEGLTELEALAAKEG